MRPPVGPGFQTRLPLEGGRYSDQSQRHLSLIISSSPHGSGVIKGDNAHKIKPFTNESSYYCDLFLMQQLNTDER